MLTIKENVNLKSYTTFGIEAICRYFTELNSIEDFVELVRLDLFHSHQKLIIGGGSNLLFTKDFDGLVIKNNLMGIERVWENDDEVLIRSGAGENWHHLVLFCIENKYAGLENLSLIPGCVGASPMQNIGAYGVEIKDVFEELEAYPLAGGKKKIFKKEECGFGYRESVFKDKYKNQFLISSVTFRLKKNPVLNTTYGAINEELKAMQITAPTIQDVSNAVIRIRESKLPDPKVAGNAGSFFKNPEVSSPKYHELKASFESLVAYHLPSGAYKLAAGWLIEQCGLKGFEMNGAAVHSKQALVLINKNKCRGIDILLLSDHVFKSVFNKFGVKLEREVNII